MTLAMLADAIAAAEGDGLPIEYRWLEGAAE